MSVLLDVNVLVALLNPAHRFRSVAHDWFGAVKTHGRRTVTSAMPGGDSAVLTLGGMRTSSRQLR